MNTDDLTEEQLDQILNSKIVQKYVAYRSLTDGVEALKEDEGLMYENFIDGVHRRVGRLARDTVEEVLDAVIAEVEDNTEFVEEAEADDGDLVADLVDGDA